MAMPPEENTTIVRRFWEEVFNQGNLDIVGDLFTSEHAFHHPAIAEDRRGIDVVIAVVNLFRQDLLDFRVTIEDEIAEGDKVVTRWMGSGTKSDEVDGTEPIGDQITVSGISIFLVSDGKIQETWLQFEPHLYESEAPVPPEEVREKLSGDRIISDPLGGDEYSLYCLLHPSRCRW